MPFLAYPFVAKAEANILADIGVRDPEDSLLRAELMKKLAAVIARKKLSQAQIARILRVDRPKVSKWNKVFRDP